MPVLFRFVKGDARRGNDGVLILGVHGLIVLETPKTGSLALRAMLEPYTLPVSDEAPRHIGHTGYLRNHAARLTETFGNKLETIAVVREPLSRMKSWYRYRMRERVAHLPVSTKGMRFADFMMAYLEETPPTFANVGRQDRFLGWNGREARVDHVFDYRRLDLLEAFFSDRIGTPLRLPARNVTPKTKPLDYSLSKAVTTQFQTQNAEEFALYAAVSAEGYLKRPGLSLTGVL